MATTRKKPARKPAKSAQNPVKASDGSGLTQTDLVDIVDPSDEKLVRPRISGDTAIALNSYAARIGLPVASLVTVACIDYLKRMGENV